MKLIIKIFVILFLLNLQLSAYAQFGFGLRGGGNLSGTNSSLFGSSKRIGYQFGFDLMYSFHKHLAISIEPVYNLTKFKMDDRASSTNQDIPWGTHSLRYINVPVYLKLNITRGLAVLGGADFNYLLNQTAFQVNHAQPAFRQYPGVGYSLGIDLGALYFRYRNFGRYNNIKGGIASDIQQYQLGFKVRLF